MCWMLAEPGRYALDSKEVFFQISVWTYPPSLLQLERPVCDG